ncbi:MAG TPA: phasin family protein [Thermoanaerobaculia bacterium]|jgi:poly(hydroxyalkanoate) granule-associated protein|nr:phasin family protein [Thermoanaerobaculia bacterium]
MSEALETVDSGFDRLRAAGRNLWLAGLGAAAEVEEGSRGLFDRLVERGIPVEGKQKKLAETVTERAGKAARSLSKLVEETVEFESRGMLKRLNLMTREDVKILSARLETLSKKIHEYAVRHEAAVQDNHETTKTTKTVQAAKASRTKKG